MGQERSQGCTGPAPPAQDGCDPALPRPAREPDPRFSGTVVDLCSDLTREDAHTTPASDSLLAALLPRDRAPLSCLAIGVAALIPSSVPHACPDHSPPDGRVCPASVACRRAEGQ